MLKKAGLFVLAFSVILGLATASQAGAKGVVIVTPMRQTLVQLGYDVLRLRGDSTSLVIYDEGKRGAPAKLYAWDPVTRDWIKTDINAYGTGSIFNTEPGKALILGADSAFVSTLESSSTWASEVKRIPLSDIATMVNGMHESLNFSTYEWRCLAKWQNLTLKDLNSDRRRYGRWGKPGTTSEAPIPETDAAPAQEVVTPTPVSDEPAAATKVAAPEKGLPEPELEAPEAPAAAPAAVPAAEDK